MFNYELQIANSHSHAESGKHSFDLFRSTPRHKSKNCSYMKFVPFNDPEIDNVFAINRNICIIFEAHVLETWYASRRKENVDFRKRQADDENKSNWRD